MLLTGKNRQTPQKSVIQKNSSDTRQLIGIRFDRVYRTAEEERPETREIVSRTPLLEMLIKTKMFQDSSIKDIYLLLN